MDAYIIIYCNIDHETAVLYCFTREYVTGFDKTLHMGYFVKIEFDIYLISSTIELFTKSETDRVLHLGASVLCSRSCHTHRK